MEAINAAVRMDERRAHASEFMRAQWDHQWESERGDEREDEREDQ
jgi:hypothetical protein